MSKNFSNQKAIIIIGQPGSGKVTQARLVAEKYNLYNVDTGNIIRNVIYDPSKQNDPEIRKERKLNEAGFINNSPFVLKLWRNKIKELTRDNKGLVLSTSCITYFEAFGDKKDIGLLKTLENTYGWKNLKIFLLKISEKDSIKRNATRTICSVCSTQILGVLKMKLSQCPFCGGKLVKRKDDKPELIKFRLDEFKKRAQPIINEMRKRGYKINFINGTLLPFKVFQLITRKIK